MIRQLNKNRLPSPPSLRHQIRVTEDRKRQAPMDTPASSRSNVFKLSKLEQRLQQSENLRDEWNDEGETNDAAFEKEEPAKVPHAEKMAQIHGSSNRDEFEEEDDDDDLELTSLSTPRGFSSENNQWNGASAIANTCYDKTTGRLLSKNQCTVNLRLLMKKKRGLDFYDVLRHSGSYESRSLAFCMFYLDRDFKNSSSRPENNEFAPSASFDVEAAKNMDTGCFLPGGKMVDVSAFLSATLCSNWFGKTCVSKAVISILKEIQCRDEYFRIYSCPQSYRSTEYPSISSEFIGNLAEVLKVGFRILGESSSSISLVSTVRGVIQNYIEKQRRISSQAENTALLRRFQSQSELNQMFRSTEPPLQDCTPMQTTVVWRKRKSRHGKQPEGEMIDDDSEGKHGELPTESKSIVSASSGTSTRSEDRRTRDQHSTSNLQAPREKHDDVILAPISPKPKRNRRPRRP